MNFRGMVRSNGSLISFNHPNWRYILNFYFVQLLILSKPISQIMSKLKSPKNFLYFAKSFIGF